MRLPHPTPTDSRPSAVLLFGELLADCFPDREVTGGAPFNVARHLIGLGAGIGVDPVLVSRIGKDERGRRLQDAVQSAGLAVDGLQQDSLRPSGRARVSFNGRGAGHSFEIAPDQAWDYIHADLARLISLSHRTRWLYFGTLAQRAGSRQALRTLLQTRRLRGFLDLNLRDPWVRRDVLHWSLGKAEIVKLNEDELARAAGMLGLDGATPRALGQRLIDAFGIRLLVVTQGAAGAWLLDGNGGYLHTRPALPVHDPVDSVGAGDAFAAVFVLGLMQDWPAGRTLERANGFAAEICRLRGAVPESDAFYQPFVSSWHLQGMSTA